MSAISRNLTQIFARCSRIDVVTITSEIDRDMVNIINATLTDVQIEGICFRNISGFDRNSM